MRNGNPNLAANLLQPPSLNQSPLQPGYQNPYGFGAQRTAGQLAPQPVSRAGMLNSSLPALLPDANGRTPRNNGSLTARPAPPGGGMMAVFQAYQKAIQNMQAAGQPLPLPIGNGGRTPVSSLAGY